jgi:putative iron-regulated protein
MPSRGAVAVLIALSCSCNGRAPREEQHGRRLDEGLAAAAVKTYAAIASASYADAVTAARVLAGTIDALLAAPSPATLDAARRAWLSARIPYGQTETFRFCDGPIDALETSINAWPIDENYVEAGASAEPPGLIEDTARYPGLSLGLLVSLNMREGETSVSTGFHVLEFLLWGRDDDPESPGDRPYTDFIRVAEALPQAGKPEHAAPQLHDRRRDYLRYAAALLVTQLEQVASAWAPDAGDNYRAQLLGQPAVVALGLAVKGMGSLSGPELSGERLTVPYETKNQENEHSCFSDSTHTDFVSNALGIQNLCLGRYRRQDGTSVTDVGVCDALGTLAPEPAARLTRQIAASLAAVQAIPAPFDRAILGPDDLQGRKAIATAIEALRAQTETLAQLAQALDVGLRSAQTGRP